MTNDLVQFLRARLDEDQRVAQSADPDPWTNRQLGRHDQAAIKTESGLVQLDGSRAAANGRHIARQDPARVLREVDAKRQLLDDALAEKHHVSGDMYETCPVAGAADGLDERQLEQQASINSDYEIDVPECSDSCGRDARVQRRLRLLALPCADHPDYRPEWAPDQA